MTERPTHRLTAAAAFAAGLLVLVLGVSAWRVPHGTGFVGLDLRVLATSSGELAVSPPGPFVGGTNLRPGKAVSGSTSVRNQTGRTLLVRVRALPSIRATDSTVDLEVDAGGARLYRGPLGGLRQSTRSAVRIASGQTARLTVRAWVPAAAAARSRGQIVDIPIELPVEVKRERG